ncbi:MAG: ATP-binding region ATPase domain protein [Frankiales bacterium]|nr:ATP-binding region ATPase domain protein [Frankiales bacterium]MCW2584677.1 ATP-binding region ATPase domain protein [Frankiales bacterium]
MASDGVLAVYPPCAASAAEARELVTGLCVQWGVEEICDDLALVVTELVANAIRHAGTDIALSLQAIDGGVRVEVRDGSTRPLRPRAPRIADEGGRGLLLVDALCHRYGVEAEPDGKRVWVELLVEVA